MTTLHVHDRPIPTTVIPLHGESVTFVTAEYEGRRFRFSIRGEELLYEVSYSHEFDSAEGSRRAWFPIAPERAANPETLQEYLYPQLVAIHEAALQDAELGIRSAADRSHYPGVYARIA